MNPVISRRATAQIFIAFILAEFTVALELSEVYTALPALMRAFPASGNVAWVVTIHFLVYASAAALCGKLAELFGLKRVLLAALLIAGAGSIISATSTSLTTLIIGRGMQGVGSSAVPLTFGLVRVLMPPARVPMAVSIVAMAATVMGSLGLLIGGVVIDRFPWQYIFYLSATVCALAIAAAIVFLPATLPGPRTSKLDIVGVLLFVPAITSLLLSITFAKKSGWGDGSTLSLLGAALAIFAVWIVYELRQADPLVDLRLMARRQIGLGNACMVLLALGALQNTQVLPIIMQQPQWTGLGFGLTATVTGLLQLPIMALYMCGSPLSGYVATRYGARRAALLGGALVSAGWIAIAVKHDQLAFLMAMDYVQALGMAVLYAAIPNVIVEEAPAGRVSEATGMLSVIRSVSMGIGSQLVAFALTTATISAAGTGGGTGKFPAGAAYTLTFGGMALASVLLFATAYALPRRGRVALVAGEVAMAKRASA
jgi:EmrB/QacA subfamily drug resistance transporter